MFEIHEATTSAEIERFGAVGNLPPVELHSPANRPADALLVLASSGRDVARCGIWHRVGCYEGQPVGVIGYYFAGDVHSGSALLHDACRRLAAQDCALVVGPMDGSTWRRYRLIVEQGSRPPFFLEPSDPADWLPHFTRAGFVPLVTYHSSVLERLSDLPPPAAPSHPFYETGGTVRAFQPDRFDEELQSLHALSLESFRSNPLFTPITFSEFAAIFSPLRDYVVPELFLLAEREGELMGFVLALPDVLQAASGARIDTIVIKSLAVRPAATQAGLGSHLVDLCHRAAQRLGFRQAIHALMLDGNFSARIRQRQTSIFRRYALLGKRLR